MKIKDIKVMIREAMGDDSILLARPKMLFEANYGNVKRKIEVEMIPFAMISAFRGDLSRSENLRKQNELEGSVAHAKFPWTKMPGSGYVEDSEEEDEGLEVDAEQLAGDIGYEPEELEAEEELPPEKEGVEVKENSILIWDETRPDKGERTDADASLFELAKFLAKKYNQDSFVYGEPVSVERSGERQMLARLYDKNGNPINKPWAGPWSTLTQINADDVFWSAIGSKRAKLSELQDKYRQLPVRSRMDAMKKQHYLDTVKSALKKFQ